MLYNVLNNPEGFYQEMRRYSGSLTLAIAFGKRAPTFERADQCGFSLKRFFDVQLKFNHMLEVGNIPWCMLYANVCTFIRRLVLLHQVSLISHTSSLG